MKKIAALLFLAVLPILATVNRILKDDKLRAQFPDITEDSNPVIQIYRPK